ncbi:hypothetical protein [Neptuniibacter sp. QD37_11]|uniref:hypothetical protein n=1 Tax=Neptuniibacter sp. QD37_11 TaxID=3398209 RepID=UPI0039F5E7DF
MINRFISHDLIPAIQLTLIAWLVLATPFAAMAVTNDGTVPNHVLQLGSAGLFILAASIVSTLCKRAYVDYGTSLWVNNKGEMPASDRVSLLFKDGKILWNVEASAFNFSLDAPNPIKEFHCK